MDAPRCRVEEGAGTGRFRPCPPPTASHGHPGHPGSRGRVVRAGTVLCTAVSLGSALFLARIEACIGTRSSVNCEVYLLRSNLYTKCTPLCALVLISTLARCYPHSGRRLLFITARGVLGPIDAPPSPFAEKCASPTHSPSSLTNSAQPAHTHRSLAPLWSCYVHPMPML